VIKKKHLNPNCIKLLHVNFFQKVDVKGSINATIHFDCIAISWKSYFWTSKPPRRLGCLSVWTFQHEKYQLVVAFSSKQELFKIMFHNIALIFETILLWAKLWGQVPLFACCITFCNTNLTTIHFWIFWNLLMYGLIKYFDHFIPRNTHLYV